MHVTVPHTAYANTVANLDPILRRIGCLVLVDFYFLLRVGGIYKTTPSCPERKKFPATRTKQFVVGNIGFLKRWRGNSTHIPAGRAPHGRPGRYEDFKSEKWADGTNHHPTFNRYSGLSGIRVGVHRAQHSLQWRGRGYPSLLRIERDDLGGH